MKYFSSQRQQTDKVFQQSCEAYGNMQPRPTCHLRSMATYSLCSVSRAVYEQWHTRLFARKSSHKENNTKKKQQQQQQKQTNKRKNNNKQTNNEKSKTKQNKKQNITYNVLYWNFMVLLHSCKFHKGPYSGFLLNTILVIKCSIEICIKTCFKLHSYLVLNSAQRRHFKILA